MHPEASEVLSPLAGYTAWAGSYDDDGNPLVAIEGPAMRSWIGEAKGLLALDLGCGTGRHTQSLLEAGARVVALDQCEPMMAVAMAKLRDQPVDWVRHALPDPLPFGEALFDLVVMGLVAEHVAELGFVLAEVERVLKPGGTCLLSALHPDRTAAGQRARFIDADGLRWPIVTFHRTIDEYLAIAESAGLAEPQHATLVVPAELAAWLPRALPYVGMPLGWVGKWKKLIKL